MALHPVVGQPRVVLLKPLITGPLIEVGHYSYYDDPEFAVELQTRNVLHHYGRARRPARAFSLRSEEGSHWGACPDVRDPLRHKTEGTLLFLGVVQPEHGIQSVEQAPKLDDILGLGGLTIDSHQKPPQLADLVLDLRMRPAHCRRRVCASEGSAHQGDEKLLVGPLVGKELALQPVQQHPHRGEVAVACREPVGR